jgi:hypothetical protein
MKSRKRAKFSAREGGQRRAQGEDFEEAVATYRAACQRWPDAAITLRQGARVIEDSRQKRFA